MEEQEIKNQVEAVLFAVGKKMSLEEISKIIGIHTIDMLQEKLLELQRDYDERNSPLMLTEEEKGVWKLTTREKYLNMVRNIVPETELSKTMMETLAVIAWKQPITQSEVIHIRTNKAYDHVKELQEMDFLVKERYGRTYLLKLTPKFYNYFDLSGVEDAKELFKEFKDTNEQKKLTDTTINLTPDVVPENVLAEAAATEGASTILEKEDEDKEESLEAAEEVEREETPEEEKEESVYSEPDREDLREDDEIKTSEDGFMQGYENPESVEKNLKDSGVKLENPVSEEQSEEEEGESVVKKNEEGAEETVHEEE